jgi:hypothetical protein
VKLHGQLIALIGPNEAGKSSVLDALALLHSDEPFARSDNPRRSGKLPELSWGFQLEQGDRDALAEIPEASSVERVVVTKDTDGIRRWRFEPDQPVRDRMSRRNLVALIKQFLLSPIIDEMSRGEEDDFRDRLRDVSELLEADSNDLRSDAVNMLGVARADVEVLDVAPSPDEADEDEYAKERALLLDLREELKKALSAQARWESGPNPATRARAALESRLPRVILYRQEDRDLQGFYDLEQVAENPPSALGHLASLAKLDLIELSREIQEDLSADVATRRDRANRTLREAFGTSWNQQKVALQLAAKRGQGSRPARWVRAHDG